MAAAVAKFGSRRGSLTPFDALVLALTLAWTLVMAVSLAGSVPDRGRPVLMLLLGGLPLALGAGLALSVLRPTRTVSLSAVWTIAGLTALVSAHVLAAHPTVGLAIPATALAAIVGRRFPASTVTAAFFLSGTFGTIRAFTSLPPGGAVDLVIAGLLAGSLMAHAATNRDQPVFMWPGIAALGLYLTVTLLQAFGSPSITGSFDALRVTGWYLLVVPIVAYSGWDARTRQRLARGMVAAVVLISAYAVFRWIVGPASAEVAQTARKTILLNGDLKLIGSFSSRHQLGAWMAMVIPFCLAFALSVRGRWRWSAVAALGMSSMALLASEARAGLVGAVAGIALVVVLHQASRAFPGVRLGSLAGTVGAIVAVGAIAFSLTLSGSEESSDRLANVLTPGQDPAFVARTYKWRDAISAIEENPFGQGIGSGQQSGNEQGAGSVASVNLESSYLKVAYEQGIAVAVLFSVAMLALLVGLGHRGVTLVEPASAGIAIGAAGTLLSFLIVMSAGLYVEGLQALAAWLIVGLGVAQFTSPGAGAATSAGPAVPARAP